MELLSILSSIIVGVTMLVFTTVFNRSIKQLDKNREEDAKVRDEERRYQEVLRHSLKNLLGARIRQSCRYFLERREITTEEYRELENMLNDYHYFGGNGGLEEVLIQLKPFIKV